MPRTGENIYRRKDGRWEGRFPKGKEGGKYLSGYVYGRTYGEAKAKLAAARARFNAGLEDEELADNESVKIFEEFKEFLEWKSLKEELHEFMASRACGANDTGLDSALAGGSSIHKSGENGKPSPENISDGSCGVSSDVSKKRRTRLLVDSEIESIEGHMLDGTDPVKLGILLCMHAGLRLGELAGLRWGDISDENRLVHIRHSVQRVKNPEESGRKTSLCLVTPKFKNAVRDVPLPEELIPIVESLRQRESCFVLTGAEEFMDPRTIQNHFNRMMREIGIEDATIEDCRKVVKDRAGKLATIEDGGEKSQRRMDG